MANVQNLKSELDSMAKKIAAARGKSAPAAPAAPKTPQATAANWSPAPKSGMPPGYGAKPKTAPKAKAKPKAAPKATARPAPNLSPGPRNGGGMPPGYGRGGSTGRGVGRGAAAGAGAARALGPRIAAGLVSAARVVQVAWVPGKIAAGVMLGAAAAITVAGYKLRHGSTQPLDKGPSKRGTAPNKRAASAAAVKTATAPGRDKAAMKPKNGSFGATFKAAEYNRRKNGGATTFTWNGKLYAAAQKGRAY